MRTHYWIIIEANEKNEINSICNNLGFGANNFNIPLYNQEEELSNYVAGWALTAEEYELLRFSFDLFSYKSEEYSFDEVLAETGLHKKIEVVE